MTPSRIIQHTMSEPPQSPVVLEQDMSLEGCDIINMLTIRHKDEKCTTRIVKVSYDANEMPIRHHVIFKLEWHLERLANIHEKKYRIECTYMVMERYKQHSSYFGDYQIRQSLTINMRKDMAVEPYIAGITFWEEI
jgi:hypothetical protein